MCVAAHVIWSELPGSAVLETQLESLMLLGRDPGTFSPLSAQLWANLSSSECLCLQSNSLLTSWSPGSQALLQSCLVTRFEALWMKGQGRTGTGAGSSGEKQRGETRRPGLLVLSKAGAGVAVAALSSHQGGWRSALPGRRG